MRSVIPLILFLFLFINLSQTSAETICKIEGTWRLSFEITNTNPYTVFVAIPENIHFSDRSLKYSTDFTKLSINVEVTTNKDMNDYYTTLNGKIGIWIPPYTTVKIYKNGNFSYILNTPGVEDEFKVIGPALVDVIKVFDETQLKSLYKYGIIVDNYRLYVDGKIIKSPDTEVISMVIPAPLVLDDYDSFRKLVGRYDVDIWVDSYREYIKGHKRIALRRYSQLYNSIDDSLIPNIDDDLVVYNSLDSAVEALDNDLRSKDIHLKLFDVPAMVFTTDDGEYKPLRFSYVMYKY